MGINDIYLELNISLTGGTQDQYYMPIYDGKAIPNVQSVAHGNNDYWSTFFVASREYYDSGNNRHFEDHILNMTGAPGKTLTRAEIDDKYKDDSLTISEENFNPFDTFFVTGGSRIPYYKDFIFSSHDLVESNTFFGLAHSGSDWSYLADNNSDEYYASYYKTVYVLLKEVPDFFTNSNDVKNFNNLSSRDKSILSKNPTIDIYKSLDGDDNVILPNKAVGSSLGWIYSTTFYAGKGNDTIIGGDGNDAIDGGVGDDIISSGTGTDTLKGGSGNDTFKLGDGVKTVTGDASSGLDFKSQADHDEVIITGSADGWKIDVADPTSKDLTTVVSKSGNRYILSGVEKLTFEKPIDAKVSLDNGSLVSETVHQAVDVYVGAVSGAWHKLEAIELDMDPGNSKYTLSKGVYTYLHDGGVGRNFDALAAIGIGNITEATGSERVLTVTFKGTDLLKDFLGEFVGVDLAYKLKPYYELFRPLVNSLKAFISNLDNGIKKVVVDGHSLGGAMTQYLVSELGDIAYGYTYGSIGTSQAGSAKITNFIHLNDVAQGLGSLYGGHRSGGTVWLNSAQTDVVGHFKEFYENDVDLLMSYAKNSASSFSKTELAKQLLGNGFTQGTVEVALGTATADHIFLQDLDTYAIGDKGNDLFMTSVVVSGPLGSQIYETIAGAGGRVVSGGEGIDTLSLYGSYSDYNRSLKNGNLIISRASDGKLIATVENSVEIIQYTDERHKFDGSLVKAQSVSGATDVVLSGNGAYAKISNGNNKVTGTAGDDTIIAGLGSKIIFGGAGSDFIRIDTGAAVSQKALQSKTDKVLIDGGSGADTMIGGFGDETYIVDNIGDVTIDAGGHDVVKASVNYTIADGIEDLFLTGSAVQGTGNDGSNILTGTSAANVLNGGSGNDTLIGGAGADTLIGGDGIDTASYAISTAGVTVNMITMSNTGDAKGDTYSSIENLLGTNYVDGLSGDNKANIINGANGNDFIYGSGGADKLIGGNGADTFIYKAVADSSLSTFDTIVDFNQSQNDKINLSVIDANTKTAVNDAFVFIGTSAFTGVADQLRFQTSSSGTDIFGDTNGDKIADLKIHLSVGQTLTAANFTL